MLLQAQNLKKTFEPDVLFDGVSFHVAEKDKVGLVGVNGAGKTTLFRMMTGESSRDGGDLYISKQANIGYMEQHACHHAKRSLYDEVLSVFSHLTEWEKDLARISLEIDSGSGDLDAQVARQHELNERYEREGGFTFRSRARAMLLGLGFAEDEFAMPVGHLSGGQKTRVVLGKLLLSRANLLLLDEPTNHLDIQAVEWLESFLRDYRGACIVISHDRYFLDRVTNRTFEMERGGLTMYEGNYTWSRDKKAEDIKALERQYANTQKEITRIEGIIEQQHRWNKERNIRTAESKQKMVDRLEKTLVKPPSELEGIRFAFEKEARGGNDVLLLEGVSKAFGDKTLFTGVDLHIRRGERVFLLGPNGCGKTTLFRIILGQCVPDTGHARVGTGIDIGYYDQSLAGLDPEKTALEELQDAFPDKKQTELRNALAAFLFKGEDVFKKISALSGGERARVSLLKLMLGRANFLLLDEPTNHLDISSREALEQALLGYDGTLFVISHDRYLINRLAGRIIYLSAFGLKEYLGNYDDYLAAIAYQPSAPQPEKAPAGENDYWARKESESAKRRRLGQLKRTEQEIQALETQIGELESQLSLPEVANDYIRIMEIAGSIDEQKHRLDALYAAWEDLQCEDGR